MKTKTLLATLTALGLSATFAQAEVKVAQDCPPTPKHAGHMSGRTHSPST